MSQNDFNKYVEKHDIMLDSEFEFVRDGKTQSIREKSILRKIDNENEKVKQLAKNKKEKKDDK